MELTKELSEALEAEGFKELTYVEGIGVCGINGYAFTVAIVVNIDNWGYERRYCYPRDKAMTCLIAFKVWIAEGCKGHPKGEWLKMKGDGHDLVNPALPIQEGDENWIDVNNLKSLRLNHHDKY